MQDWLGYKQRKVNQKDEEAINVNQKKQQ